jgi:hypothetical protein
MLFLTLFQYVMFPGHPPECDEAADVADADAVVLVEGACMEPLHAVAVSVC